MKFFGKTLLSLLIFCSWFLAQGAQSKLLDKIMAVVDDRIITYSEVQRVQENYQARRNISPQIYDKETPGIKDLVALNVQNYLISNKLAELGYKITDDQVEEQIKATEQRIGLGREALLKFLAENNITFPEYFEIIRATIEYNIFKSRVIVPMISLTEQQIKNEFFNKNLSNKALAFKYSLVDFSITQDKISRPTLTQLPEILRKFQTSGILPEELKNIQTNDLGNITEEGLEQNLVDLLKKTDEGSFSRPILINNEYHVFFVKKKDLVESELYQSSKDQIKNELFEREANKMMQIWFQRETDKHFIKYFLN